MPLAPVFPPLATPASAARPTRTVLGMAFLLLLGVRAACDPLFDATKEAGGMGLGALANAAILLLAALAVLRRPAPLLRPALPLWLPFLLLALASTAIAPSLANAVRLFLVQLSYAAVFVCAFYLVRSASDLRVALRAIVWSSAIPVAAALVILALQGGVPSGEQYRLRSTFSHANVFAFYLVLLMAVILYWQKSERLAMRSASRRWLWLYCLLLLFLLACTRTRSAWLGALLVFGLYGLLYQRRFLLYAALVPALLLLDPALRARVSDLGNTDTAVGATNLDSFSWRLLLWQAGLRWMDHGHMVLGYGLDAFKHYSPQFFPLEGQDTWDPHNVYVQLFFETGACGLLAWLALCFGLSRRLWRGLRTDRPGTVIALALLLNYLLTSYSDNMLYYLSFNWYFWFFMGSVCAAAGAERGASHG